jgi:hypothetical protein
MNHNRYFCCGVIILVAALAHRIVPWVSSAEHPKPPNILVLIADDLGWHDVGYHGSEIRTPHLGRLASEGVCLERHYVWTTCSPTGLRTGAAGQHREGAAGGPRREGPRVGHLRTLQQVAQVVVGSAGHFRRLLAWIHERQARPLLGRAD